jgi:hypothetical protein
MSLRSRAGLVASVTPCALSGSKPSGAQAISSIKHMNIIGDCCAYFFRLQRNHESTIPFFIFSIVVRYFFCAASTLVVWNWTESFPGLH